MELLIKFDIIYIYTPKVFNCGCRVSDGKTIQNDGPSPLTIQGK